MIHLKYEPTCIEDMSFNNNIVKPLTNYIIKPTNNTIFNLYGDSGSGKTTLIKLIIKELKIKFIEINLTSKINKDVIHNKLETFITYNNGVILFEDSELYINDIISYLKTNKINSSKIIIVSENVILDIKNKDIIKYKTNINNLKLFKKIFNIY